MRIVAQTNYDPSGALENANLTSFRTQGSKMFSDRASKKFDPFFRMNCHNTRNRKVIKIPDVLQSSLERLGN